MEISSITLVRIASLFLKMLRRPTHFRRDASWFGWDSPVAVGFSEAFWAAEAFAENGNQLAGSIQL
jgi:hypothetical protein